MYLVSPDHFRDTNKQLAPSVKASPVKQVSRHKRKKLHPYDKWIMMRKKIEEKDVKREALIKEIARFLERVLPAPLPIKDEPLETSVRPKVEAIPSDVVFETPKRKLDVDNDRPYGEIASPFLSPYVKGSRMLDTQYGIRKVGDNFMIGNATVTVDNTSDLTIKGEHFKGTKDLWNLLTRKNVNYDAIDEDELKKYKTILEMTNAHLEGYRSGNNIQTSRGPKFKNVIARLFPEAKVAIRQKWVTY